MFVLNKGQPSAGIWNVYDSGDVHGATPDGREATYGTKKQAIRRFEARLSQLRVAVTSVCRPVGSRY